MLQHHMPLCLDISSGTLKATSHPGWKPPHLHAPMSYHRVPSDGFLPPAILTSASPSSLPQPPCTAARELTLLTAAPGENTRHQPLNALRIWPCSPCSDSGLLDITVVMSCSAIALQHGTAAACSQQALEVQLEMEQSSILSHN